MCLLVCKDQVRNMKTNDRKIDADYIKIKVSNALGSSSSSGEGRTISDESYRYKLGVNGN